MKIFETERLILEPIGMEHCTATYLSWLNDPEVYRWLETRGSQTMPKLQKYIQQQVKNKTYMWAIKVKSSSTHIGNIKIDPINKIHSLGEFGILMGDKTEWGKGYAREASLEIMNYFFKKKQPLRKITLGVVDQNKAAVKLYKNLGFGIEGIYKDHVCYDGSFYTILRMAKFNSWYGK
jgi:RimJ/RimL family protein N-acetyltransferase